MTAAELAVMRPLLAQMADTASTALLAAWENLSKLSTEVTPIVDAAKAHLASGR